MTTHTKDGPWVDSGLTGPDPRIVGGPLRLIKCQGVVIAFLPAWLDDFHEEALANARLIAAAPDLLEALIAARDAWGQPEFPSVQVNAAILKAKGPTP